MKEHQERSPQRRAIEVEYKSRSDERSLRLLIMDGATWRVVLAAGGGIAFVAAAVALAAMQ